MAADGRTVRGEAAGRVAQEAVIRVRLLVMLANRSRQFVEQCLRLFEVRHIEAFGEPAVVSGGFAAPRNQLFNLSGELGAYSGWLPAMGAKPSNASICSTPGTNHPSTPSASGLPWRGPKL
jgi:hypothetical protein